jgi:hypothetical protein
MPIYPIIFMVILLPLWIAIEGYDRLSSHLEKKGHKLDILYVLLFALSVLAIVLFLLGVR